MSRRGAGEGSIYRRKDGRWTGAFLLPDGRRKQVYGRTRQEVSIRLREAQELARQGFAPVDERLTVGAYLERWLQTNSERVRPRTLQGYELNVRLHIAPIFGKRKLAQLGPDAVQALLAEKLKAGLSPQTVRNVHATLRSALNQAVRWGLLTRNVASLVSPPRVRREELRPLSVEEARRFLEAASMDRLRALYHLAMLGLRQGELLGLRWQDVDLDAQVLRVQVTLQRHRHQWELVEPKTARSRRTIPLPPPILRELRGHRTRQQEERLRAGSVWVGNEWGLVFCREDGAPLSASVVTRRFQVIAEGVGLGHQRFHILRHSAASTMIAQGVPLRTVMEVLGHSEIGTTANIYGHLTAELTRDATERMGRAIWGTS